MKFYKTSLLINLLSSSLISTSFVSPGYAMEEMIYDQKNSTRIIPSAPTTLSSFREELQVEQDSKEYYSALQASESSNEEDKKRGFNALRTMIQNKAHSHYYRVARYLFSDGSEDDKEVASTALREIAQNHTHTYYYNAAVALFYDGDEKNKEVARSVLRKIAQNNTHPYCYEAGQILLYKGDEEDKKIAAAALNEIIQNCTHPDYFRAVSSLINVRELPEATLLNLLSVFSVKHSDDVNVDLEGLENIACALLKSQHPDIQKRAENLFLDNPLTFMKYDHFLKTLEEHLTQHEKSKKDLWLQKICENLTSSSLEDVNDVNVEGYFNASCFVLKMSDKERFVVPAKQAFFKMTNTQLESLSLESFILQVKLLLQSIKDVNLKEHIVVRLFDFAKSVNMAGEKYALSRSHQESVLVILLEQNDEKIKTEAIILCQKLLGSIDPTHVKQAANFLSRIGLVLTEVEGEKALAQQILTLLNPEFEERFLQLDTQSTQQFNFLKFFMKKGNEKQQLRIFNFLKESVITPEDQETEVIATNVIIETLGIDHPWAQEIIELATKRQNASHPNSPFMVHRDLCEKVNQPVKHFIPEFRLGDKRSVTFNLKTLKTPRQPSFMPIKHHEFVSFTKQLFAEADKYPEEFKSFATTSLIGDPQSAIEEVSKTFFINLLDTAERTKDPHNVSLTSFKLRHILAAAKALQAKEKDTPSSQELSASSQLILSLLNNILTCPTGKEDGIDQTYRLLTNQRGASEQDLQQKRLREEMHEFFKEEMRRMREGLLNGEGPVVRSLLNVLKEIKIEEPPHQQKYLHNLLGGEIGIFLENKNISFDQNGGCVLPELRKCSKQKALDTLYQHHTPESVISHFYKQFNSKGFEDKIDGKNTLGNVITEFLTPAELDSDYIVYNDSDVPINLTPLAIAEILIRANILEVIKED